VISVELSVYRYWQAIDKARDMVDTELTALAAESYSRAYGVSSHLADISIDSINSTELDDDDHKHFNVA